MNNPIIHTIDKFAKLVGNSINKKNCKLSNMFFFTYIDLIYTVGFFKLIVYPVIQSFKNKFQRIIVF